MINHYFFLRKLAADLDQILTGSILTAVVSPHKDELQLFFEKNGSEGLLRLNWETNQFLVKYQEKDVRLPKSYEKQLFDGWNREVLAVEQALFDRYWFICLACDYTIVVKCFASAGNAMLLEHDKVTAVFRRSRQRDFDFTPSDTSIEKSKKLQTADSRFLALAQKAVADFDWPKWAVNETFAWSKEQGIHPVHEAHEQNALDLASQHASWYLGQYLYAQRMGKLQSALTQETTQLYSKIAQAEQQLREIDHQLDYQTQGSLLLSHLQDIKPGAKQVALPRWDLPDEIVTIKLDSGKSVVENANRLFQKAKNQHIEREKRSQYLDQLMEQLELLEERQTKLQAITNWRELLRFEQKQPAKSNAVNPWRVFRMQNMEVWIGKHAQGNDEVLRRAHKDDLWLHARGVSGSHVLVRNAGKKLTQPQLEKVAAWAAFYSKGRSEQYCPVSYTERKYVRKPKGAVAGAVVMERENVIIVTPLAPVSSE